VKLGGGIALGFGERGRTLLDAICRVVHEIAVFLFAGAGNTVDRTALWTGAIAIVTALAAGFALIQLRNIRHTSRADFTKRFIDSFFVEDTRTLFTLLLNSALEFAIRQIEVGGDKIDELPYLRIKKEIADQLTGIVPFNPNRTGYSAFEVDDVLLGHFEDVGWYVQRKLMDLKAADQSFGYYVIATVKHSEMQKFLEHQRSKEFEYEDLEWLYQQFKKLEAKRS
jgi:hypothetical protein